MKVHVNEMCIGCGICEAICPEVFHMNDNNLAEADSNEATPDRESLVQEAAESCPSSAIEVK